MIEISNIKSSLLDIVHFYASKGMFSDTFVKEFEALFDKNTLRIGVIGKMKAGKSSLVNALIFGNRVLPTGDKPVTVTLTEITYGNKEEVEVELLSESDIEELRKVASLEDDTYRTHTAKDLIESIDSISGGYKQYTAKGKVNIPFSKLQDYVAADGKLSGLAKNVSIKINNKNLQGVTIVDTPGFNDPIESRGETTKNAIKKCQILLFVHDYFDRYDEEEVAIASEQIEYAGISEVIDVVNKTDQESDAMLSDWEYLADDYKNNRTEILSTSNPTLRELMGNSPVICVSALMSLLGSIPDSSFDDYDVKIYNRFRERYEELKDKGSFYPCSNIPSLEKEINLITRNSSRYLLETPLLKLVGELSTLALSISSQIEEKECEYNLLNENNAKYNRTIEDIQELIDSVLDILHDNALLSSEMQKAVNSSRDELLYKRSETISKEFTDDNFPEPGAFTSGVKKQNLGNYCTILLQMDGKIRVVLDGLKKTLISAGNLYVENLIAENLTSTNVNITDADRKKVEIPLKSVIEAAINRINLTVETDRPSSFPEGMMTQKVLYLSNFQSQYSDKRIQKDFISTFNSEVAHMVDDFEIKGAQKLNKLKQDLINAIDYTPEQKETQKVQLQKELSILNHQMDNFNEVCESLKSISKLQQEINGINPNSFDEIHQKTLQFQGLLLGISSILKNYDDV